MLGTGPGTQPRSLLAALGEVLDMAQRPELRKGGGGQGGVKGEERENGKGCGLTGPLY